MINFSGKKYDATYFFKNLNNDSKKKYLVKNLMEKLILKLMKLLPQMTPCLVLLVLDK